MISGRMFIVHVLTVFVQYGKMVEVGRLKGILVHRRLFIKTPSRKRISQTDWAQFQNIHGEFVVTDVITEQQISS